MKVALYARVSTTDQHCEMQLAELCEYAARRGWQVAGEYVDTGWSGDKRHRPELDRLMRDASEHRCDGILVWKLDRFGRSMLHLVEQLQALDSYGVRFIATTQAIDTDQANPTSRLLLHILAAVAEFEREIIRERVKAGLENAKRRGAAHGRPRRVFRRDEALELRQAGLGWGAISKRLGVPVSTVRDALAA